jgi:hypothetical protein
MKHAFIPLKLSPQKLEMLAIIQEIIKEFQAMGYKLTLRQLYYQLVSKDLIANKQPEYSKISSLLKDGRMMGLIDWNAIEDRLRVPRIPYCCDNIQDALQDTADQYRIDRCRNQDVYIEVWAEKDALSSILYRVTEYYHVRLMVNRGYTSCSAMYEAYQRMLRQGKSCTILYLGDHDPSGLDMVRDIKNRFEEFGLDIEVQKIALTTEQVKAYNPPPNPAKITDPRAKGYIEKFGPVSWEVDALRAYPKSRITIIYCILY